MGTLCDSNSLLAFLLNVHLDNFVQHSFISLAPHLFYDKLLKAISKKHVLRNFFTIIDLNNHNFFKNCIIVDFCLSKR